MIISVASGKGGTGKTTIAASLASVIKDSVYIDCDVEEPNGHLFLKPEIFSVESVTKLLPSIDQNKCTFCGKCSEVCEFNALINLKFEIVLIEELCHSCGACSYFCPEKIITEKAKEIGTLRIGIANGNIFFADGILNIGEAASTPLIKAVKKKIIQNKINIIDAPPGTSCSMVETVKDSDYCILVTESTPFGLNDLKLAIDVLKMLEIPFGVVINKYEPDFEIMDNFLNDIRADLLLKIPFNRKFAESYSDGILPIKKYPELKKDFVTLYNNVLENLEKADVRKVI